MRIRSIRAQLTLWYSSLLTVTFLILAGTAYGLLVYSLSHDMDAALKGVGQVLVERAHSAGSRFFPSDIDEVFQRFFGFSPLERYFDVLDPIGRRETEESGYQSRKLPLGPKTLQKASRGLPTLETVKGMGKYPIRLLTVPVMEGSRVLSLVQVGMSLKSMHETRRRFLLIMAALLPLGLLLAGGGGWLLARRAFKPVQQMTEAAHRISAERLTERLEERGNGDELDRLATTLNEMLGRLDSAFSQIRQFSADASHELQTPLTILKGELEVALRSPRSAAEYRRILRSGLEEIDRIAHLVEGLLILARADAGVLRMDRQPVDLAQLAEEVFGRAKVLADSKNVRLRLISLQPLSIHGDFERLRQLLLNLVDNGIKYTASGGQVSLSLQQENGQVAIRVSDTGIGLSQEDQERIFQPFYRTAAARLQTKGGVGLGLSIARSIAEAHGGSIQVESRSDQGSTFTVLLPLDS